MSSTEVPVTTLPNLVCDVRLGERNESFDFDIEGYTRWLHTQHGLDDEQVGATTLSFDRPTLLQRIMFVGAYTDRQTNTVHVLDSWGGINEDLLIHETQHLADNFNQPEIFNNRRTRFVVRSYLGSAALSLTGAVSYATAHNVVHNAVFDIGSSEVSLLGTAVMLGSYLFYRRMPHEVRAWRAGSQPHPQFIALKPKPVTKRIAALLQLQGKHRDTV